MSYLFWCLKCESKEKPRFTAYTLKYNKSVVVCLSFLVQNERGLSSAESCENGGLVSKSIPASYSSPWFLSGSGGKGSIHLSSFGVTV